jgi:hypothetical protein
MKETDNVDVDVEKVVVSADLQKVLLLPVIPGSKTAIFTPRLVVFNETFTLLGEQTAQRNGAHSSTIVWHEAEAGRSGNTLADVFFNFLLLNRDKTDVTIWMDNSCSGQNKNFVLFTMFVTAVNTHLVGARKITLKYLEAGHAFMSADSIHHGFELAMRKAHNIYDFEDLLSVLRGSNGRKCEVLPLKHT